MKYILMIFFMMVMSSSYGRTCQLSEKWNSLCCVLEYRTSQSTPKMKLTEKTAKEFEHFLNTQIVQTQPFNKLKMILPKTTVELLMGIQFRGVSYEEAEKIAQYLIKMTQDYQFKNIKYFDNNTSHIIGREWNEIDYSGEGMTWQKQKLKYERSHITNFKTLDNIRRFFPVESKLPYFAKIYQPRYIGHL